MREDHLVKIVTHQVSDGQIQDLEMTSLASFCGTDSDYCISYSDGSGDTAGCVVNLHVEGGRKIIMCREGGYKTRMTIEKDVRHISQNVTPYGSFFIGIQAKEIDSRIKDGEGTLHFKYLTDVECNPAGEIDFDITLKKRKI